MEQFGVKDLYKVVMRATYNMKVGNRDVLAGEPVLYLDGAQMFAMAQSTGYRAARGGKNNLAHVIWENAGDVTFAIQKGVISPIGYALLTNLQALEAPVDGTTILTKNELVEVDDYGKAYLKQTPLSGKPLFVYNFANQVIHEKIIDFSLAGDVLDVGVALAGTTLLVDYSYNYGAPALEYRLGKERFNGFLSLEARYYSKGESGTEYTNIIYVPKMKVLSDISLRVGENVAGPTLSTFNIVALAEKIDGESVVMRMLQLEEDVDGL